jgi:hypothetical protein
MQGAAERAAALSSATRKLRAKRGVEPASGEMLATSYDADSALEQKSKTASGPTN